MRVSAYIPLKGLSEQEKSFIVALKGNVKDEASWLAYADWLIDNDRPLEAALAKAKTSKYSIVYRVKHLPTGKLWAKKHLYVYTAEWELKKELGYAAREVVSAAAYPKHLDYLIDRYGGFPLKAEDLAVVMVLQVAEEVGVMPPK